MFLFIFFFNVEFPYTFVNFLLSITLLNTGVYLQLTYENLLLKISKALFKVTEPVPREIQC